MRKIVLITGVALLLAGLAFLVASSVLRTAAEIVVNETQGQFEITSTLEKSSTYVLDIYASSHWRNDFADGGYEDPQPVDIVITSPNNNTTSLSAFFYATPPNEEGVPGSFPLVVMVEYRNIDSESLDCDIHYPQIRFTVKQSGLYRAQLVSETINWTIGPPRSITISKEVTKVNDANSVLLQGGGILCIAGVGISVLGAKSRKLKTERKKLNKTV